jgi:hypothetical protein
MLPDLVADPVIRQYRIPRRWLYPDPLRWIDEVPWWPDFQIRLVRNEPSLRFTGDVHTSADPAFPARYLEAPHYHLAFFALRQGVPAIGLYGHPYDQRRLSGLEELGDGQMTSLPVSIGVAELLAAIERQLGRRAATPGPGPVWEPLDLASMLDGLAPTPDGARGAGHQGQAGYGEAAVAASETASLSPKSP